MDTTYHTALAPDEQHAEGRREALARLLRDDIRETEAQLARVEAQLQQLAAERERKRLEVEQAYALLRTYGYEPDPVQLAPSHPFNGAKRERPKGDNFVAGNRSEKAPERRPDFATVPLVEAARQLLATRETMRLDDLADAIYEVRNPEQLFVAKGALRSAMAVGIERRYWTRESPGAFRATPQVGGETM